MTNHLEKLIHDNYPDLLENVLTLNQNFLDHHFSSSKNISAREILFLQLDQISQMSRVKLLSKTIKIFPTLIHDNNEKAINVALNLYNKYQLGLSLGDLLEILENRFEPIWVRKLICEYISNYHVPSIEYWLDKLNNPEFEFMLPSFINKTKYLNPYLSLKYYLKLSPDLVNYNVYIPLKRAIVNFLSTDSRENYIKMIKILEHLNDNNLEIKLTQINSILNLPELVDIKYRLNSISSELKYFQNISELQEDNYQLTNVNLANQFYIHPDFFNSEIALFYLGWLIYQIKSHISISPLFMYQCIKWYENKFGNLLYKYLYSNQIYYNPRTEIITYENHVLKLTDIPQNELVAKYRVLKNNYGSNRLEKLNGLTE